MANEQNLMSPQELNARLTPEERRQNTSKAGKASREKQKRKKTILKIMDDLDRLPLNEIGKNDLKRGGLDLAEVDPEDLNGAYGIVAGMYIAARQGNHKAFEQLARYKDEQRKDRLEIEKLKAEIRILEKELDPQKAGDDSRIREMVRVLSRAQVIVPFRKLLNGGDFTHGILTSGRAGTKSSAAAIAVVEKIVTDDNCSVVVIRKHHNKLRKTVYKEILRAMNRLGLDKSLFTIHVSPMEITYNQNGNTIYFTGSESIDDTKGIIDEKKPIKRVLIDEATEFFDDGEGEDELQNIEATFIRGNEDDFQMLYLYNPPKNPNAAIVKWCRKMEQRPDVWHAHVSYLDVVRCFPEWLGQKLIEAASILKDIDERQYRWVWLGESVGIDEAIYYMFGNRHVKKPGTEHYRIIGIGGDYGQQNATTFQAFGLDEQNHRLDGLGEFYHSGRESGYQKSPSEYAKELIKFCGTLDEKYAVPSQHCSFVVYLDPSAQGLKEEIKRALVAQRPDFGISVKDAENDVKLGISRVQKLLSFDRMSISPLQVNAISEFGTYEYDKDSIEKGKEEPVKVDDHTMDAIRYLVMGFWKYLKAWLPAGDEEDEDNEG